MQATTKAGTRARIALMVCCAALLPAALGAQSDDDANGAVQFDFSTPGARSLALGGAFVGSADDATAAYTNPAGLFQLSEPEVSVEGRQWAYSTPFANRGRFAGSPTGIGADNLGEVELGRTEEELDGVSYASFVFPKPRWAFALYYHQVANFEANFTTDGVFLSQTRLFPVQSSYALDISQIGAAFAFKWRTGSAGIGVSSYHFELESLTQRYDIFNFEPAHFDVPVNFQRQSGEGDEVGFTAGLRFELSPTTRVGLVYRFGPEFDVNVLAATGSPGRPRTTFVNEDTVLDLPDVAALGVSYQPRQNLTVNFDLAYVLYSQLIGNQDEDQLFVVIFGQNEFPAARAEDFVIDDATEVRLGIEYVFAQLKAPLALRAGAWWDPDHRLRYEGGYEPSRARFFAGDDEVHFTAGLGLVFGPHLQLDAAADVSDNYDVYSLSTVVRF